MNGVDDDEDSDDDADADADDFDGDVTWRRSFLSLSLADSFKVFTATVLVPWALFHDFDNIDINIYHDNQ